MFRTLWQVAREMFIVWSRRSDLVEKIISSVIFDTNCSLKRWNALSLTKQLLIKVFMARCSHLVIFYLREKFCVSHASASRSWHVYCLKPPIGPCGKNYISGHIWHKSFIKTVKCFYGAPLTFNYVLLQGKVLCFGTRRQVNCEMFILSNLVSPVPFDKKKH